MKCKKCGSDTWVGVETGLCDKCKESAQASKGQEAQQVQNIAEIKQEAKDLLKFYKDRDLDSRQSDEVFDILRRSFKVIDSQAQKIAEQAKEIERLKEQVKVTARQVHDAAQLRL